MFMCGDEKAEWYLSRNLAKIISENKDGKIIQLTFKPNGMGHSGEKHKDFFLSKKEERCAVCGSREKLNKHHCVPRLFRSAWSKTEKNRCVRHTMHDVLLLCLDCHRAYEIHAAKLKDELVKDLITEYQKDNKKADECIGAIKTIKNLQKNSKKMPHVRIEKLLNFLKPYLNKSLFDMSEYEISEAIEVLKKEQKKLKVEARDKLDQNLRNYMEKSNLKDFFILWRKHFVETMKPEYMHKGWDINYWRE